jgi:hypothetical protein
VPVVGGSLDVGQDVPVGVGVPESLGLLVSVPVGVGVGHGVPVGVPDVDPLVDLVGVGVAECEPLVDLDGVGVGFGLCAMPSGGPGSTGGTVERSRGGRVGSEGRIGTVSPGTPRAYSTSSCMTSRM